MQFWKKMVPVSFFLFLVMTAVTLVFKPDADISRTERRRLAQQPKLSVEAVLSGTYGEKMESYLQDQLPGRNLYRIIKTETETRVFRKSDANGYVQLDGSIYKINNELNEANVRRAAEQFSAIAEELSENATAYYALIPNRTYFLTDEMLETEKMMSNDEVIRQLMQENMKGVSYIDLYGLLDGGDYYRTDLHWKQEKIPDVADTLLLAMQSGEQEMSGDAEEPYQMKMAEESFYGGYAGASAFLVKPETMYYLTNTTIENATVYDYEKKQEVPVYAPECLAGTDPYDFYLWGARALLSIKNPQQENGKKLLLFRDSFGSSLAPLLIEGYSEITLVDLRYISADYLKTQIDVTSYDTVLFLYSTELINHSDSLRF